MKNIIIKQGHSKNCCIYKTKDEYYFVKDIDRFNFNGDSTILGRHNHRFLEILCNDPGCQFRAVLSAEKISTLIKSYVKYHKK
jgi:hypothetical protein